MLASVFSLFPFILLPFLNLHSLLLNGVFIRSWAKIEAVTVLLVIIHILNAINNLNITTL